MDTILSAVPAECPLRMPPQDLRAWPGSPASPVRDRRVTAARVFVFGFTAVLVGIGTYGMYQVISPVNVTWLQILFATIFALTFTWISFACASACLGFWVLLRGRIPRPPLAPQGAMGRTALLMPLYNETPADVFATLERIGRDLVWAGAAAHFDIFVLSDTRKDDIAAEEQRCHRRLHRMLGHAIGIHYRRRADNHHRKAGNIADFVTRWGGAYDHMIVLDADSDMSGAALTTLARAMAADPQAGIIQTLPLLRNRWTPYARMTQFAGRVYGPVVAAGLAAWHGRDGNYWGHNAIIRTRAFAEAAGLPELPGRRPFGGHVLSHDFVEAALMRRAGWAVYMLPDLAGSYEETPPSLIEVAVRDRRWAQGNLQHSKIVGARGLHWLSRVHLIQGIMSYAASPLWLLLLVCGLGLATIARFTEPNYFPDGFSLFPAWPVFDPELALRLLGVTAAALYLPKLLGIALALRDRDVRAGCGGAAGLLKSAVAETAISMLLSPVMMVVQSGFVVSILMGRDSGWHPQNRNEGRLPAVEALRLHWLHMAAGLGFGTVALVISSDTFLWFLPITLGLILAPAVTWATSCPELGRWLWRCNVFRIPEEQQGAAAEPLSAAAMQPAE